jgi:hypothetical protein
MTSLIGTSEKRANQSELGRRKVFGGQVFDIVSNDVDLNFGKQDKSIRSVSQERLLGTRFRHREFCDFGMTTCF